MAAPQRRQNLHKIRVRRGPRDLTEVKPKCRSEGSVGGAMYSTPSGKGISATRAFIPHNSRDKVFVVIWWRLLDQQQF